MLPAAIVTLARLAQEQNALTPMLVTWPGMLMLVKLEHPVKAKFPILVTPAPSATLFRLVQESNARSPMSPLAMVTLTRLLQDENAEIPREVTFPGMVRPVRLEQKAKAKLPMLVTLLPSTTLLRFPQELNA